MKIDITAKIGPMFGPVDFGGDPEWPMYSFARPAYIVWNAIANQLYERGWTENEIQEWLQSKAARWALDGDLGTKLEFLGRDFAKTIKHP